MDDDEADFDRLVSDALDELPDDISEPDDERRRHGRGRAAAGAEPPRPLPGRAVGQARPVLLGRAAGQDHDLPRTAGADPGGDPERLRFMVRRTVFHEIAHHFGISDQRLVEIDRY